MERGEWVEKPLADAAKRATAALQRKIMMVGVSPLQYIIYDFKKAIFVVDSMPVVVCC